MTKWLSFHWAAYHLSWLRWFSVHWIKGPAESNVLEQVKSCSSVSCLINMEPLELLHLQLSELSLNKRTIYCKELIFEIILSVSGIFHAVTSSLASWCFSTVLSIAKSPPCIMQAALASVQFAFFPRSDSRYKQLDPIYPNGYEHSMTYTENKENKMNVDWT